MTDEEVVQSLQCCIFDPNCAGCPAGNRGLCRVAVMNDALVIIKRQQSEINSLTARLKSKDEMIRDGIEYSRTQTIREFAERLKKELSFGRYIQPDQIDNLVKEMVGDNNAE